MECDMQKETVGALLAATEEKHQIVPHVNSVISIVHSGRYRSA